MKSIVVRELPRVLRAVASNQIARWTPGTYLRLTGQTGRGATDVPDPARIAEYFVQCLADYEQVMREAAPAFSPWLVGRKVLEYGPGDLLGAALLMRAAGAATVCCVDRFALARATRVNVEVYWQLVDGLDPSVRRSAMRSLGDDRSRAPRLDQWGIDYRVREDGVSGASGEFDLIVSRAVLEHVDKLEAIYVDMFRALVPGGFAVHQVDLRSHGLDRFSPLDFLEWPEWAYHLMYGSKGFPNRARVDEHRRLATRAGFDCPLLRPTERLDTETVERLRHRVDRRFADVPLEDLSWLGFWMVLRKPGETSC